MLPKVEEGTTVTEEYTYRRGLTCEDPAAPLTLNDLDDYWCCHL